MVAQAPDALRRSRVIGSVADLAADPERDSRHIHPFGPAAGGGSSQFGPSPVLNLDFGHGSTTPPGPTAGPAARRPSARPWLLGVVAVVLVVVGIVVLGPLLVGDTPNRVSASSALPTSTASGTATIPEAPPAAGAPTPDPSSPATAPIADALPLAVTGVGDGVGGGVGGGDEGGDVAVGAPAPVGPTVTVDGSLRSAPSSLPQGLATSPSTAVDSLVTTPSTSVRPAPPTLSSSSSVPASTTSSAGPTPSTVGPATTGGVTSSSSVQVTRPAVATTRPAQPPTPTTPTTRPRPPAPATTVTPTAPPTTPRPTVPTTAPSSTTTTAPPSGRILWEENFDRLDPQQWSLEHSTYGDGNNELQCYRPENVSVSNGKLVLQAVTERYTCPSGSTRSVTSGMIRSRGVTFSPGQALEFRVKLTPADENDQSGLWPAVWSSGWGGGGWPAGGELDFLEVMTANNPKRSIYSIHYAKPGGAHGTTNRPVVGSENFSASWHTVRFDYGRNGQLAWHLDGRKVFSVSGVETNQGYPRPFNLPISELKINLALGGRPGPLSPAAVGSRGATFEVDFIRILEL